MNGAMSLNRHRGYAAIGLFHPKNGTNIGGAIRAAHCYGAALVAIEGDRSQHKMISHPTNTSKAERHIPVFKGHDLFEMLPHAAIPIAVEFMEEAIALPKFKHPSSAFYIFGPEDGSLDKPIVERCKFCIMIPTQFCMNLAATVNVVLYDRLAKQA